MVTQDVKDLVNELIDRLKISTIFKTQTILEQISQLLLMKRFEFFYQDIPESHKWSTYRKITSGQELVSFVNLNVLPFIRDVLIKKENENYQFEELKLDKFFLENYSVLSDLMDIIDNIYIKINIESQINNKQYIQWVEGDLYEYILVQTLGKDMYAKFDIQKHLSQFIVKLLDPDIFKTIGDLACGTGGFLVSAYQHIVTKYSLNKEFDENELEIGFDGGKLNNYQTQYLKDHSLFGFENDDSMAFLSVMNLIIHGANPRIIKINTLSSQFDEYINERKFDYVFCNPPFGAKVNRNFELRDRYDAIATELLFLHRIIESLNEDGKAAVIVPEGVLFNTTNSYIETRRRLMDTCKVEGIISFPVGLFQPYTAVKTSLLIFTNAMPDKRQEFIWFYDMKSDGYSLDSGRQKLKDNPLPQVIELWKNRNKDLRNDRGSEEFWIPYQEIIDNDYRLNINTYKLISQSTEAYEDPESLLEQLFSLEEEIRRNLNSLRNKL